MAKDSLKKIAKIVKNFSSTIKIILSPIIKFISFVAAKINLSDNLKKRIKTSLILIAVAIYAICFSLNLFFFLTIIVTILMTLEWQEMIKNRDDKNKWLLVGLFYISIPICCVLILRVEDFNILLWMFSIIWATDICAYFAGKFFSSKNLLTKKLAPSISPNKTIIGLVAGFIASLFIGFLSASMFENEGYLFFTIASGIISIIEQISDLVESKFKRIFNVKDSGSIIAGHGGVLDRLDGMMLVAPVILILVSIFPNQFQ
jgi:phosphatidate cytidylyltransferase